LWSQTIALLRQLSTANPGTSSIRGRPKRPEPYITRRQAAETPAASAALFEFDDAVRAFVKSRSERRDLTKGEKAMGLAFLFPEPDKRGRGNKGKAPEAGDFSRSRLQQARSVLRHSPALASKRQLVAC
jgi:hypothetical protein